MEPVYASLTSRALKVHHDLITANPHHHHRTLIAFAGPPGSGKSTVAAQVAARLNSSDDLLSSGGSSSPSAIVLPMDGFHLSRSTLDSLPNSTEAHARRGAAWTFDADGVVALIQQLRDQKQCPTATICAPAFDHAVKDPVLNAIIIPPEANIIIVEGNWLLYDAEPWARIKGLVDDSWFVDVESDLARERIARRHLEAGIAETWEEAVRRAEENDLVNGLEVRRRLVAGVGVEVVSVDEKGGLN